MCFFSAKTKSPTVPKEYAAQKSPTRQDAQSASERMSDRIAAVPQTQMTDQTDLSLLTVDTTGKKKLGA